MWPRLLLLALWFQVSLVGASPLGGSLIRSAYADDEDHLIPASMVWQKANKEKNLSSLLRTGTALISVSTDGVLTRYDTRTGEGVWRREYDRKTWNTPVRFEDLIIVASSVVIHAFDLETGREVWTFAVGNDVFSQPLIHDGKLIFGTNASYTHVLDAATGKELARFVATDWVGGNFAVIDDSVFFADSAGVLISGSISQKTENWRTTDGIVRNGRLFTLGTRLFRTDQSGALIEIDPATGAALASYGVPNVWIGEVIGEVDGDLLVSGVPASSEKGFTGAVARIRLETGETVWSYARPIDSILTQFSILNNQIVFGSEARLGILDIETGAVLADLLMVTTVEGVAQDKERVFVSTSSRGVMAFRADPGDNPCPGLVLPEMKVEFNQTRTAALRVDEVGIFAASTEASQQLATVTGKCTVVQITGKTTYDQRVKWVEVLLPGNESVMGWVKAKQLIAV